MVADDVRSFLSHPHLSSPPGLHSTLLLVALDLTIQVGSQLDYCYYVSLLLFTIVKLNLECLFSRQIQHGRPHTLHTWCLRHYRLGQLL